tara:strand:+ start:107 stop:739 length:633 start_codon:yes stop_codon:yes gene_type:complete
MFSSRRAEISDDIDIHRIKSTFLSELVGTYDTYLWGEEPLDIVLVDPYSKFFFVVSDLAILFSSEFDSDKYCFLPYVRMIWVARHQRSRGLQRRILEEMKEVSDDVGQSFAVVADPFELTGTGREVTAYDGIRKLFENDISPTQNYMWDLVKQRERFINAGLYNVKFGNAQISEPYQHFVYVSKRETEENISILKENELTYIVNPEKIGG